MGFFSDLKSPLNAVKSPSLLEYCAVTQVLQQRLWCNIFAALSGVLALAYICLGLSEMRSPGGMQHHAAFASRHQQAKHALTVVFNVQNAWRVSYK